jgi:hypothetical protein
MERSLAEAEELRLALERSLSEAENAEELRLVMECSLVQVPRPISAVIDNDPDFQQALAASIESAKSPPRDLHSVDYDAQLQQALAESIESERSPPEHPLTLEECVLEEVILAYSRSFADSNRQFIARFISEQILGDPLTLHIIVRGNGFCGFNALLALLMKMFPEIKTWDYSVILAFIRDRLAVHGFTDQNPSVIDERLVRIVMREFLDYVDLPGMKRANFVIIALDEESINVDLAKNSLPENTFLIVHKGGHFNAIYVREEHRTTLYGIFKCHMET